MGEFDFENKFNHQISFVHNYSCFYIFPCISVAQNIRLEEGGITIEKYLIINKLLLMFSFTFYNFYNIIDGSMRHTM